MHKCVECDKDATWIRHTQFAGDHPYCTYHAKKQSDFGENDSYTYWSEVCCNNDCNQGRNCPRRK